MSNFLSTAPEQICQHLIFPLFVGSEAPVIKCGLAANRPSGMPTDAYVRCAHGHVSAKEGS